MRPRKNILVWGATDDAVGRWRMLLELRGYRVMTVHSELEARDAMRKWDLRAALLVETPSAMVRVVRQCGVPVMWLTRSREDSGADAVGRLDLPECPLLVVADMRRLSSRNPGRRKRPAVSMVVRVLGPECEEVAVA